MSETRDPTMKALIDAYRQAEQYVGCGDNSCRFKKPIGMATNGGCRCVGRGGDHRPGAPWALGQLFRAVRAVVEQHDSASEVTP